MAASSSGNDAARDGLNAYRRYTARKAWALAALLLGLALTGLMSLLLGSSGLTVQQVLGALFTDTASGARTIVRNVRLPRLAVGAVVGAALAMAGCVMQNVLRNPLASASTLGVLQGASFGAAVAILYLGAGVQTNAGGAASAITVTNPYTVSLCAFLGGMTTTAVVLLLSRSVGMQPATMVLAGVALSALFTGATALLQYFADDVMVASVVYWTFGSLGRAGWHEILLIAVCAAAAFVYFMFNRWNYNAMEGGAHTAKSLGVPVNALVLTSMVACALVSAVSVAFVGSIGFVGLIAPHIARRLVGNDHRFLIPASALLGSILMALAEIASRMLMPPAVLPIGALTSFLGAPLFLYLAVKGGRSR